jgi:hypothetical protein
MPRFPGFLACLHKLNAFIPSHLNLLLRSLYLSLVAFDDLDFRRVNVSCHYRSAMLCETCKNIFLGFLDSDGLPLHEIDRNDKRHHYNVEDLHKAAAANCQICVQLFMNLQRHYWTIFTPNSTFSALEKEQTMITEMMASQESYSRNLDISARLDDEYLLTYDFWNFRGPDELERHLPFVTRGHHFNTSRDPTRDVFESYVQSFVMLPSKGKFTSLVILPRLT